MRFWGGEREEEWREKERRGGGTGTLKVLSTTSSVALSSFARGALKVEWGEGTTEDRGWGKGSEDDVGGGERERE
jgi:hypothetical protein